MISIKRSVNDLEARDRLIEKSIECYRDAVRGIGEYAVEACPPLTGDFRRKLSELEGRLDVRKLLHSPEAAQTLQRFSNDLLRTLSEFSIKSVAIFREDTSNLRGIMAVLAATAEALNSHNQSKAGHFRDFGKQLEALSRIDDLILLRHALSEYVVEFRVRVDEMHEESRADIHQLQQDVRAFRQKLDAAEMEAATDPLTGTFNRRELQRQIDNRIEMSKRFSLLMFDLDEFKSINDRFGHPAGDQILKYFVQAVKGSVRPGDVVARWGGDEFIVLLDAGLDDAISRSRHIFAKLEAPVAVQAGSRTVMLAVRASSGAAERRSDESSQSLFTRVDALLYANKPASRPLSTV